MVVPTVGIRMRCFFASSTPLRIASGTSPALPSPTPTWPCAVTHDDDRAEAEAPAALDDLGDAVDLDDALLERELGGIDPGHCGLLLLEVESGFAGGVGERLDPPVVPEPGSIEDDLRDPGGSGPLGDEASRPPSLRSTFVCFPPLSSGSSEDAAARVRPAVSSMTWA